MMSSHPNSQLDATVPIPAGEADPEAQRLQDASFPTPGLAPSVETLAGRYAIISLLGSGGMGAVYKAKDLTLGELIAVKVLRGDLNESPEMVARFIQEVKLARRVTHANVARTYDFGEHGPHKFLTMELIVGASLHESMNQAPLSVARVVEIATAVARGLGAAHAAGVVHRDLKPDNVLLANDGRIVITDFGIARLSDGGASDPALALTLAGTIGTPAYMAPEQVEGARDVDGRADIYALGTMLYELFTGQRAWEGDSVFVMATRRLVEPPPDPRSRRPDLPLLAAEIVQKCMARSKADRFQTAEEVAQALAGLTVPMSRASLESVAATAMVSAAPVSATVKAIAVLPFQNTGSPGDEYLADGLTDDLIDVLSMTAGLRVCSRGVVMARAKGDGDPRKLGHDLSVDAVVLGSLRRADDRLRVTARVLSVGDGFQLWAQRFDRKEGEFFEVNDAVARAVAEALTCKVELAPREPATDPVALDLYLRARHEYFKWWRESVIVSIALFEQALARAPNDAMILAGYAMALSRRCGQDDSTDAHADAARDAADKALAISPDSAPARVARAAVLLLSGRSAEASEEVHTVLARCPSSADATDLAGRILAESGPPAEAIRYLERALDLEPNVATAPMEIARLHALLGDRGASDAFFGDEPAHPGLSNIYWIHRCRAALWLSDLERAREWRTMLEPRRGVHPGVHMMLRAMTGDLPTTEQLESLLTLAQSETHLRRRRSFYAQIVCEFAASFGRPDVALRALESSDEGLLFDAVWLERCRTLEPIRAEPRFLAVKERVIERAARVRQGLRLSGA